MIQFQNLRQGSQVFILHKSASPFVEAGTVESIANMPMLGYYPNLPMMPLDMTVRVGEKVTPYQKLPANAEAVDVVEQTSGETVTVACSKEAINAEVQNLRQKSIEAINSVEYHKQRINVCETLLKQLNPEQAEKEAQQEEMRTMKEQMSAMQKQMEQQAEINRQLLARLQENVPPSKKQKDYEHGNNQDATAPNGRNG